MARQGRWVNQATGCQDGERVLDGAQRRLGAARRHRDQHLRDGEEAAEQPNPHAIDPRRISLLAHAVPAPHLT